MCEVLHHCRLAPLSVGLSIACTLTGVVLNQSSH
jgi:hypothetical protein